MNKYAEVALKALDMIYNGYEPILAWNKAAEEIFNSISMIKKGCPKNAFLGLCEEGIIKGVKEGNYTSSKKNKEYVLKAVEYLINNDIEEINSKELWNIIGNKDKKHNGQMDIVLELWKNKFIEK